MENAVGTPPLALASGRPPLETGTSIASVGRPSATLADLTREEALDALLVVQGGSMRPPIRVERTELDADAKALVVLAAARTGRPLAAAQALGYSPAAALAAMKGDAAFALDIEAARSRRVEDMEASVDRRAFDGIEEVTYNKDGDRTVKLVFSDKLAELRLKSEAPAKYMDRKQVTADIRAAVLVVPAVAASTDAWHAAHSAPIESEAAPACHASVDGTF